MMEDSSVEHWQIFGNDDDSDDVDDDDSDASTDDSFVKQPWCVKTVSERLKNKEL